MSGSTIGGVVGYAVGFYIGGPAGGQVGWMIGSAVGGYVDPEVIKGPRLKDAQVQTSMEGAMRPIVYGAAVCAGNVIQTGPLVETKHRERTGKGGPVQETYRYSRTYAIRVCEGPIAGIRRIWRDDKLVYDTRDPNSPSDDTPFEAWARMISDNQADTAAFASKITIYLGDEAQLPDPLLEALPPENGGGIGNVPAYRGSAYVVLHNDDLTDRQGAIPQYRFEVISVGTEGESMAVYDAPSFGPDNKPWTDSAYALRDPRRTNVEYEYAYFPTGGVAYAWHDSIEGAINDTIVAGADPTYYGNGDVRGWSTQYTETGDGVASSAPMYPWDDAVFDPSGNYMLGLAISRVDPAVELISQQVSDDSVGACSSFSIAVWARTNTQGDGSRVYQYDGPSGGALEHFCDPDNDTRKVSVYPDIVIACRPKLNCGAGLPYGAIALPDTPGYWVNPDGTIGGGKTCEPVTGTFLSLSVMTVATEALVRKSLGPLLGEDDPHFGDQAFWDAAYAIAVEDGDLPAGMTYQGDGLGGNTKYPSATTAACKCLQTIAPISPDAVFLGDIERDIAGRVGIQAGQFDTTQIDAIPVRGMLIGKQMSASDALRTCQQAYFHDLPEWGNILERATKLRAILRGGGLSFDLTDDDLVESEDDQDTRAQAVEFPRKINLISPDPTFNYEPTKQTAERRTDNVRAMGEATVEIPVALTRDESAQKADIMLKVAWTEAEGRWQRELPEEFSVMTPSDCFTHNGKRWRAEKCEYADGSVKVDAVRDRPSTYVSTAMGSGGLSPAIPPPSVRGPTIFAAMNLPSLRSSDTVPGMYVAARGLLSAWRGCQLQLSIDGGATYANVLTMTSAAVIGSLTAPCSASIEPLRVATYAGDVLESVTDAQMAAHANAFALGSGVPEVGQFKTATGTGPNAFELTDVTRGLLSTRATAHGYAEPFVLLDGAVYFLPLDASLAGQTLLFRPVTFGTAEATNATYSVVYDPQFTAAAPVAFLTTIAGSKVTTSTGEFIQVTSA